MKSILLRIASIAVLVGSPTKASRLDGEIARVVTEGDALLHCCSGSAPVQRSDRRFDAEIRQLRGMIHHSGKKQRNCGQRMRRAVPPRAVREYLKQLDKQEHLLGKMMDGCLKNMQRIRSSIRRTLRRMHHRRIKRYFGTSATGANQGNAKVIQKSTSYKQQSSTSTVHRGAPRTHHEDINKSTHRRSVKIHHHHGKSTHLSKTKRSVHTGTKYTSTTKHHHHHKSGTLSKSGQIKGPSGKVKITSSKSTKRKNKQSSRARVTIKTKKKHSGSITLKTNKKKTTVKGKITTSGGSIKTGGTITVGGSSSGGGSSLGGSMSSGGSSSMGGSSSGGGSMSSGGSHSSSSYEYSSQGSSYSSGGSSAGGYSSF